MRMVERELLKKAASLQRFRAVTELASQKAIWRLIRQTADSLRE
jgi:hypothetical protein